MKKPILSVLTPVFNNDKYLRSFIQKVIDQQCPHIEHIIVDDGSSDDSLKIIEEFASKYPHIRYAHQENQGISGGFNSCIRMANADFISLLGLNDYYEPGVLNEVVKILPSLKAPAILIGDCNVYSGEDTLLYVSRPRGLSREAILAGEDYPPNPAAYFYHKSLHEMTGYYDTNEKEAMDLVFLLKALPVANVTYRRQTFANFCKMYDSITSITEAEGNRGLPKKRIKETCYQTLSFSEKLYIQWLKLVKPLKPIFRKPIEFIRYCVKRLQFYLKNPKVLIGK